MNRILLQRLYSGERPARSQLMQSKVQIGGQYRTESYNLSDSVGNIIATYYFIRLKYEH